MSKIETVRNFLVKVPLTQSLIILNIAIFVSNILLNTQTVALTEHAFGSSEAFNNHETSLVSRLDKVGSLFTYSFLHLTTIHLILNMISLAYFGVIIERSIGSFRFGSIYLISGIGAALFHASVAHFMAQQGHTFLVGASGAIFGILGCAAARGNKLAYLLLIVEPVAVVISYAFAGVSIALSAHIGGFAAGFLAWKIMSKISSQQKLNDDSATSSSPFVTVRAFLRDLRSS
jgi:membrane associated rhomboid family serine protease